MSDDPTVDTIGDRGLQAYLTGMEERGELLPGAKQELARRFDASKQHGGLKSFVGYWSHGDGQQRYGNPERVPPATPEAPLRQICRRFGGVLAKGEADELYAALATTIDPKEIASNPEQVAERVWHELHKPQHRSRWRTSSKPPLSGPIAKAREALRPIEGYISPLVDLDDLAARWKDLGDMPDIDARRVAARRLGMASHAKSVTVDGDPVEVPPDEYLAGLETGKVGATSLREEFIRMGQYDRM